MVKMIVTGSRDFNYLSYMFKVLDGILMKYKKDISIISAGRRGAETRGECYARANRYSLIKIRPDFKTLGLDALLVANREMIDIATHCICFINKHDPEMELLLKMCEEKKIKTKRVFYDKIVDWIDVDNLQFTYDEI